MESLKVIGHIQTIAAAIAANGVSTVEPWKVEANVATVVSAIASAVGTIIVSISVILIWLQLKQQERLIRNANSQALVDISSPFNMALITDKEVAKLWLDSSQSEAGFDPLEQARIKNMSIWWFVFYENIYMQFREGLLHEAIAFGWNEDLKKFIQRPAVRSNWVSVREVYHPKFQMHVNDLIGEYLEKRTQELQAARTQRDTERARQGPAV